MQHKEQWNNMKKVLFCDRKIPEQWELGRTK